MAERLEAYSKWKQDEIVFILKERSAPCHPPIHWSTNYFKKQINVLGVTFDSKLQWTTQVAKTMKKAKSTLHSIKLIKAHVSNLELKQLITSNFYSVLFYNSEI